MYKERIGKNISNKIPIGNIIKDRSGQEWKVVKVFKKISNLNNSIENTRNNSIENKQNKQNKTISKVKPKVGQNVHIIVKPYYKKIIKSGIIKRVLTKKKYHSRGHKVMLLNGKVGRVI